MLLQAFYFFFHADLCGVQSEFNGIIKYCYPEYSMSTQEEGRFDKNWQTPLPDNYTDSMIEKMVAVDKSFVYQSVWDLKGLPYM